MSQITATALTAGQTTYASAKVGDVLSNANGKRTAEVISVNWSRKNPFELLVTDSKIGSYYDSLTPAKLRQYFPITTSAARYSVTLTDLTAEQLEAIKALVK